jgi:hypothetical protein
LRDDRFLRTPALRSSRRRGPPVHAGQAAPRLSRRPATGLTAGNFAPHCPRRDLDQPPPLGRRRRVRARDRAPLVGEQKRNLNALDALGSDGRDHGGMPTRCCSILLTVWSISEPASFADIAPPTTCTKLPRRPLDARYAACCRPSADGRFPPVPAVRPTVTIRPLQHPDSGPIVGFGIEAVRLLNTVSAPEGWTF